ncbi:type II toxin-antitoxin system RelE/ParE family toxin [Niveispirillum sp.]|uniref:type II toxin-antitoxin system RelE/ParE family toxin n=1 Tax=Niveispirillum sp. TaxID=1917217 RepID=UPI001B64D4C0|nr:type II toxin-antitoxin system RelE/ParE family toxin [Niveispirillum sp.]MBP7339949.1 type II toxin-antitoxin system RelE/ParE family toxin [Niveispirillum sp.]
MSMPVEVLWYPQARTDLADIYVVIGIENPMATERTYDALEMRAHQLGQHPRLGPRRPDIQTSTRVLVEGPYLILYETHPDTDEGTVDQVTIVRVIDGRRDLAAL